MKHRKLLTLLLAVVMVLNTAFVAMADVDAEAPAADAENTEVLYEGEDGSVCVTHGAGEGAEGLLGGITDTDYPVISDFEIVNKTVSAGEKLVVKFKATDANGINPDRLNLCLYNDSESVSLYDYYDFKYDENSKYFTVEYKIEDDAAGKYRFHYAMVQDAAGYYSYYIAKTDAAAQKVFPGYAEVTEYNVVTNVELTEAGKTLNPGDTFHVKFNVNTDKDVECISATFTNENYNSIELYYDGVSVGTSISYDPEKKTAEGTYTLSSSNIDGTYTLSYIDIFASDEEDYFDFYYDFEDDKDLEFTLEDAYSMEDPWLKEVKLDKEGQTLNDNDEVTLTFTLDVNNVSSISASFKSESSRVPATFNYHPDDPYSTMNFDPQTGKASVTFNAMEKLGPGDAYLNSIIVSFNDGSVSAYVSKYYTKKEHTFTVVSEQVVTLKQFILTENGKNIVDGDEIHLSAEIELKDNEAEADYVLVVLTPESTATEIEDKNISIINGTLSKSVRLNRNSTTGLWAGTGKFSDTDVNGLYHVSTIFVYFVNSKLSIDCSNQLTEDQYVIFADNADTNVVSFNMNGHGSAIPYQLVASGSVATKPANPAESGYTFGGWFKNAACAAEDAWDFLTDKVTETITLFAKWTKNSSGGGSGGGSGTSTPVVKPDPATTPITTASDGSQMMGTSTISKPMSKLTAEEKASLVETGAWTKDAYGRWSLKNGAGAQVKSTWALVSDALCSKPVGNATWYYFDANGYMVTGWQWIQAADGNRYCYYFNKEDGSMYGGCLMGGTTKDGYNLDSKGRWINAVGVPETK